jgi:sortase A
MRSLLRWTRWLLAASAVSLLAYAGFVLADTWVFQRAEDRQLESLVAAPARNAPSVSPASLSPAANGGLIGRVDIPRLGISAIMMEGTGSSVLRRAVGHIRGTALPGERGNVGISGHRDTFFRPLRNIAAGDFIVLTTVAGEYRYRVVATSIVAPDDVAVLAPGAGEILTIVTCYPFYFVGPAPKRFIVRAQRVTETT